MGELRLGPLSYRSDDGGFQIDAGLLRLGFGPGGAYVGLSDGSAAGRALIKRVSRMWSQDSAQRTPARIRDITIESDVWDSDDLVSRWGTTVYRDMVRDDPEIACGLRNQIGEVLTKAITVQPGNKTRKAAEVAAFIEQNLRSLGSSNRQIIETQMTTHYQLLHHALTDGCTMGEPVFVKQSDGKWPLDYIAFRPVHDFELRRDDRGRLVDAYHINSGETFAPAELIIAPWLPLFGNPYGEKYLRAAYRYYKLKILTVKQLAIYVMKAASGTMIGRYPAGSSKTYIDNLLAMLRRLNAETVTVLESGATVEPLKVDQGPAEVYRDVIRICDQQIAKLIVGAVLGADKSEGGAYSRDKVARSIQQATSMMLSRFEAAVVNRIVQRICDANYATSDPRFPYPIFSRVDTIDMTPDEKSKVCVRVFNMGGEIDPDFVRNDLGIPITNKEPLRKLPGSTDIPDDDGDSASLESSPPQAMAIPDHLRRIAEQFGGKIDRLEDAAVVAIGDNLATAIAQIRADGARYASVADIPLDAPLTGRDQRTQMFRDYVGQALTVGVEMVATRARSRGIVRASVADSGWQYESFVPLDTIAELENLFTDRYYAQFEDLFRQMFLDTMEESLENGWTWTETADTFSRRMGMDPMADNSKPEYNWRLRRTIRTAFNEAYTRSTWTASQSAAWVGGFLYCAIRDARTTPFCIEHHGQWFAKNDPYAAVIAPPNHWHCRSDLIPVFADEAPGGKWTSGDSMKTRPDSGFDIPIDQREGFPEAA